MASEQERSLERSTAAKRERAAEEENTSLKDQLSVTRKEIESLRHAVIREAVRAAEAEAAASNEIHSLRETINKEGARAENAEVAANNSRFEVQRLEAQNCLLSKELSESNETMASLKEDLDSARDIKERCKEERERLEYVLATNCQEGSVPLSILAADQGSVLYKMFSGDWNYARESRGRALITCHPDRWAAILEHLATGAIPTGRDSLLLAQARHWNLRSLVNGLEALTPGLSLCF